MEIRGKVSKKPVSKNRLVIDHHKRLIRSDMPFAHLDNNIRLLQSLRILQKTSRENAVNLSVVYIYDGDAHVQLMFVQL